MLVQRVANPEVQSAPCIESMSTVVTKWKPSAHAQVRGKTVYLQYSTRNEIINSTVRAGEGGGSNILLVSLENMDVSVHVSCYPVLLLLHTRSVDSAGSRSHILHSFVAACN